MDTPPLAHIPLFARLDDEGRAALMAGMRRETVTAEQVVFWFGDRGDTLYVVDRGSVAITAPDVRGDHVLLDTLHHRHRRAPRSHRAGVDRRGPSRGRARTAGAVEFAMTPFASVLCALDSSALAPPVLRPGRAPVAA